MHLKVEFLKHQMEAAQQVHLIVHMVVLLIIIPVPFINVIIMAQKLAGGHGVPELVPEWVDGQEYPQGEDEPVDDGTNVPSYGNQKEEPNQYNIG